MTSANLLDCSTGRSAGFAPLRIWMRGVRPVSIPAAVCVNFGSVLVGDTLSTHQAGTTSKPQALHLRLWACLSAHHKLACRAVDLPGSSPSLVLQPQHCR